MFENMKQYVFSAPGRSEISGNHTDHQHGCVLAAAVDLKTTARITLNHDGIIRVQSEGYPLVEVDVNDLTIHPEEKNTTAALIRGVAASFAQRGAVLQGFDAQVSSTVLPGSGLSSSAAFEVLIGSILNTLFFQNKLDAVEIAKIGQYAENMYFGKPCGLMDQTASSVGGMVFIDFADPMNPRVEKLNFDFAATGYALCIIDTGAGHADLTDEYAAITQELHAVCRFFGKETLRDVPEDEFWRQLPALRDAVGDRPILRAIHVYNENRMSAAKRHPCRTDEASGSGLGFGVGGRAVGRAGSLPGAWRRVCRYDSGVRPHRTAGRFQIRYRRCTWRRYVPCAAHCSRWWETGKCTGDLIMDVNCLLASLVQYGLKHALIEECDQTFILNQLLDALALHSFEPVNAADLPLEEILKGLLDDAVQRGLCAGDITSRDLLDNLCNLLLSAIK